MADFTVANIDQLKTYVRAGTLDAVLVRPLSTLGQLVVMDLREEMVGYIGPNGAGKSTTLKMLTGGTSRCPGPP